MQASLHDIVVAMKGKDIQTAEQETGARKRTRRRRSHGRTRQRNTWTLKALGGKTIWDWMQLLIVPLALTGIGIYFTMQQNERQQQIEDQRTQEAQKIENQRAQAEQELAHQGAQDAALQAYLDQMSQLMLEGDLRGSEEGSEVRTLARARTRTVLARSLWCPPARC
jgi:uncharacterized protein HemX